MRSVSMRCWWGLPAQSPGFLDSFSDPVVGHLSDNTRSRWGRRRPWLLAGLLISAPSPACSSGMPRCRSAPYHPVPAPGTGSKPQYDDSADPDQPDAGNPSEGSGSGEEESWWTTAGTAIGAEWETFLYLTGHDHAAHGGGVHAVQCPALRHGIRDDHRLQ